MGLCATRTMRDIPDFIFIVYCILYFKIVEREFVRLKLFNIIDKARQDKTHTQTQTTQTHTKKCFPSFDNSLQIFDIKHTLQYFKVGELFWPNALSIPLPQLLSLYAFQNMLLLLLGLQCRLRCARIELCTGDLHSSPSFAHRNK